MIGKMDKFYLINLSFFLNEKSHIAHISNNNRSTEEEMDRKCMRFLENKSCK